MDAIASSKARKQTIGCSSKKVAAAYFFLGLLVVWQTVLAFAIVANLPVETFEAVTDLAALSSLAILGIIFWYTSTAGKDQNAGDSGRSRKVHGQADVPRGGEPQ